MICRHEAAVGAYLTRRAGRGVAEELLGEVWAAAFGSRANYDRSFPDARPWLFGVALNTLRRHWRSRRAEEPGTCWSVAWGCRAAESFPRLPQDRGPARSSPPIAGLLSTG
ncbi:MAG: sigma factor [Streptosporangiaceae bacterium]